MNDYKERTYLSAIEVAKYLGITVKQVHNLLKSGKLKGFRSASGQYRFDLRDVKEIEDYIHGLKFGLFTDPEISIKTENIIPINGTTQTVYVKDARDMKEIEENSVHLMLLDMPPFLDSYNVTL